MKVLHIIPSISLSQGGPSRSVVHLINHLVKISDVNIFFYAHTISGESQLDLSTDIYDYSRVSCRLSKFLLMWPDFFKISRIIEKNRIDLVHIHGVWHPLCHWAARASRFCKVPYVVQPRGMLEPWANSHKKIKKSVATLLYQRRDLKCAIGFIATSDQEVASLRVLGLTNRTIMIPNGVEAANVDISRKKGTGIKIALFMSRIHPKKGVRELLEVWAKLRPRGWCLRIVGPDDGGHIEVIRSLVDRLNLDESVRIIGPVYGNDRISEYVNADLFVLPTYSENFGLAVVEALSYGIPVLTTTGAPWSTLIDNQCGWWISPGVQSLSEVLPQALAIGDSERQLMGQRARQLAANYDWGAVSTNMMKFYLDILSTQIE